MGAVCTALAYAVELSERTLAATAALIGAARFALMSDIAARSGSGSPASSSSSSRVSLRNSWLMSASSVALSDRCGLLCVGIRNRVVGQDVERSGEVHGRRDVGVDQRHGGTLGERLASELVELCTSQLAELLRVSHGTCPPCIVFRGCMSVFPPSSDLTHLIRFRHPGFVA